MSIIMALLVFSVLVIVHEFGHYIAAVKNNIPVKEFAIGMGPKLFHKKFGETEFSLRLLPIGGFCNMVGEDEESQDENALCNKPLHVRMIVVVAGAVFNIVYAILVFIVIYNFVSVSKPVVKSMQDGFPAKEAGLVEGDRITSINGSKVRLIDDVQLAVALDDSINHMVNLEVERGGTTFNLSVPYLETILIDKVKEEADSILLPGDSIYEINGIRVIDIKNIDEELKKDVVTAKLFNSDEDITLNADSVEVLRVNSLNRARGIGIITPDEKLNFFESIGYGFQKTAYCVRATFVSLGKIVTRKVSKDQIAGPVGIIKILGDAYTDSVESAETGGEAIFKVVINLLSFSALLSINLGIINLLPLPALDGGRLFIMLIELVRRKPMDLEKEAWIHFVGFILLMALMVLILYNDIARIIKY